MSGPILPRSTDDPTGTDRRERAAIRDFSGRLAKVLALYLDALKGLPVQKVTVNAEAYRYQLDPAVLSVMLAEIGLQVDRLLLEGGEDRLWFSVDYAIPSYQQGTAAAWANLGAQSAAYVASRPTLEALLTSDAYRRRISYLRAREFELMKGFTADTKKDMALILSDGLAAGLNPRTIAGQLRDQMGIEQRRAERIARTEVPNALRQARMDEAQATGLELRLMHISALSPTTRQTHRDRHAKLYEVQAAREWWAKDANSVNCYVPGTAVAGRFVAGSKAYYEGVVVRLVTAGGKHLTVTPNHPVLTPSGLVKAGQIAKGDYLFAHLGQVKDAVGVRDLNGQLANARIEDVFGTLVELGHSLTRRVQAVDFHGDGRGMDEYVHVVGAERVLPVAIDAALAQCLDQLKLKHAHPVPAGRRALSRSLRGVALAASRIVRCLGKGLAFFGGASGGAQESGVALAAGGATGRLEPARQTDAANPSLSAKALDGFAGQVALDKVVDVKVFPFAGHVYDLQETSGLMVANGIIASNCKCSPVEVLTDADGTPLDPNVIERARRKLDA